MQGDEDAMERLDFRFDEIENQDLVLEKLLPGAGLACSGLEVVWAPPICLPVHLVPSTQKASLPLEFKSPFFSTSSPIFHTAPQPP